MIKKTVSLFLSVVLLALISVTAFSAYAQNIDVEGVYINKPDVTFYVDKGVEDITDIKLNNEAIDLVSVSDYSIENEAVAAYVIVDVSGSIPSNRALDVFKDELIDFAKTFGEDDKFVLYAMGDEAKMLLSGDESIDEISSAINNIQKTNENSYIYNTLNDIYNENIQPSSYDRQFIIIISDGINYSNVTSYEKIYNKYISHSLPIYSLLYDTGSITSNRTYVSEFVDLVNDSGGYNVSYTENTGEGKLSSLIKEINDKQVVKCSAASNAIDKSISNNVLSFKCGDELVEIKNVLVTTNRIDESAPVIEEIKYDKESGNFVIVFSENISADTEKISVTKNNKTIPIGSCSIEGNKLVIKPKQEVYTGKYTFNLNSVTDVSNEKNALAQTSVTEKVDAVSIFLKIIKDFWWILIVIALLVAILLILLFVKNKKGVKKIKDIFITQIEEENVEVKHTQVVKKQYYSSPQLQAQKLSMFVEFNGNRNKIEINIVSSVIVGRSKECDICIEDSKLSRQHFAIETINNRFAISDLNTTNGTYVNGAKVHSKQLLQSGDKILAGTSMFVIL